jgi:hypothetical protein
MRKKLRRFDGSISLFESAMKWNYLQVQQTLRTSYENFFAVVVNLVDKLLLVWKKYFLFFIQNSQ